VIVSCLKIPKLSLSRIPTSLCGRQAGSSATRYRPIFSTSERDIGHVFPRPRRRPGRHRGPTGSHAAQSSRREDWLRQSPWQRQTTLSSRIIDIWATTSVCVCVRSAPNYALDQWSVPQQPARLGFNVLQFGFNGRLWPVRSCDRSW